jgi:hypothetical protein
MFLDILLTILIKLNCLIKNIFKINSENIIKFTLF